VQFAIGRRPDNERSIVQPELSDKSFQSRAIVPVTHDDPPPSAHFRASTQLSKRAGKNVKAFISLKPTNTKEHRVVARDRLGGARLCPLGRSC
tara:strand:+ start:809 stop:1087 length:279 start_codon:yes stop_codon:yes gene_type:complete